MNELFIYFIQFSVYTGIFYMIYRLFLARETFFAFNRAFLLSALLLSLLLPTVNPVTDNTEMIMAQLPEINVNAITKTISDNKTVTDYSLWIISGYFIISGLLLMRHIRWVFQIGRLAKHAEKKRSNGIDFYFIDKDYPHFSFFNLIFVNKNQVNDNGLQKVIRHELAHTRQWHSLDSLLTELIIALFWFNPVLWFYRRLLKELHEYMADNAVISTETNAREYKNMLFNCSTKYQLTAITNSFNCTLLKRRFIMMNKKQSKQMAKCRIFLVVPLILIAMFLFNCAENEDIENTEPPKKEETEKAKKSARVIIGEEVYYAVDEMPEFEGGINSLQRFIAYNVKYPHEAREQDIMGKVYVSFVVSETGKVKNVEIKRGVHKLLDEEALRVVRLMPDWKPGKHEGKPVNVGYVIPISFNLQ